MLMVEKSISVTRQQDDWIKVRIESGHFRNESEVIRDLIRERQMSEQETPEQIAVIRAKLEEAERSGVSNRTLDEIWEEARREHDTRPIRNGG